MILTLGEIHAAISPATFSGDIRRLQEHPAGISTDSRQIKDREVFFALRGERFDGHDFALNVQAKALAAVVEESWFERAARPAGSFLVVRDSLQALQKCGQAVRRQWGGPVVAIGGSNGKTTTKELVFSVLAQAHPTHRTPGNLNNHIGVPLTLAGLQRDHRIAVVEMGTNHFGEMAQLCAIAEPDHGLITNIGREHLEFFQDLAGVARAELELFDYLTEHRGRALVNIDDPTLRAAKWSKLQTVTYGFSEGAQVRGVHATMGEDGCATFSIDGESIRVPIPGAHNALNALAAVAVCRQFGVSSPQARAGIESCGLIAKRMQVERIAGVTVINDAYNANPESMRAALDSLVAMPAAKTARRVAVLGDMLELGAASLAAHREVGEKINRLSLDAVFSYGKAARELAAAVNRRRVSVVSHFDDKAELCSAVSQFLRSNDLVLVKGSRGMAMEEVIEELRRKRASSQGS